MPLPNTYLLKPTVSVLGAWGPERQPWTPPILSELTHMDAWVWGVGPPRQEPQGLRPQAWLSLGACHAGSGLRADRDPPVSACPVSDPSEDGAWAELTSAAQHDAGQW